MVNHCRLLEKGEPPPLLSVRNQRWESSDHKDRLKCTSALFVNIIFSCVYIR